MRKTLTFIAISLLFVSIFGGCSKKEEKGIAVQCSTKFRDIKFEDGLTIDKKEIGFSFAIKCPAKCSSGAIWGTNTYTSDSSLCLAAIHQGVIKKDSAGVAKVNIVKSLEKYTGSEKNGIKTSDWATSWGNKAFSISK